MRTANRCRRAFTLVEMLIVIVVIGILAGIYLLAAEPAIERANKAACISDRATMKRVYYLLKAENIYTSSADLMTVFTEAVKNDLGRSNVGGNGGTFYNICRDGGVYTCSLDENGALSILCNSHDELSANTTSPVITNWSDGNLSALIKSIAGFSDGMDNAYHKYSDSGSITTAMANAIQNLHLNPNGYAWYLKKDSSSTIYFVVATSDTTGKATGSSISAVRYLINPSSGRLYNKGGTTTGTVTIKYDGTINTDFKAQ